MSKRYSQGPKTARLCDSSLSKRFTTDWQNHSSLLRISSHMSSKQGTHYTEYRVEAGFGKTQNYGDAFVRNTAGCCSPHEQSEAKHLIAHYGTCCPHEASTSHQPHFPTFNYLGFYWRHTCLFRFQVRPRAWIEYALGFCMSHFLI